MSEDEQDDGAPLGGTVMIDTPSKDAGAFGGTVMLDDDAPRVGSDGTVLIDSPADLAADAAAKRSATPIPNRSSKPPALPSEPPMEDTSLPPEVGLTPAPPQAQDLTFGQSGVPEDTTDETPSQTPSTGVASPPSLPQAMPAPTPPEPPKRKAPEPYPPKPSAEQPAAAKAPDKAALPAAAKPKAAPLPGGAASPAPAPPKKFPLWAQLLALVVVAGGVGHLVARMQKQEVAAPTAQVPAAPAPLPKEPKPTTSAVAPLPEPPAPAPEPVVPAPPAPEPAPVAAADLSSCVAKEMSGITLPSERLKFVCEQLDANSAQRKMSAELVTAKDVDHDARGAWNKLGWYRMAKLQVVRSRCCGDAPPLAIADAFSACGLSQSLAAMHQAERSKASLDESIAAYKKAVDCLFKANTMRMFGLIASPGEYQHDAFVKSLSR